jgi:hypothetical protein
MKKDHCKIHGYMTEETAYVCKTPNGGVRLRCKKCSHDRRVESYYLNREKNIAYSVEWKKNNREYANQNAKENYHKDIHFSRAKEATRKKGINLDKYNEMLELQNYVCAICKRPERAKVKNSIEPARLAIDHCHKLEAQGIRKAWGLLCRTCNLGFGYFEENKEFLQGAMDYVDFINSQPSNT